MGDKKYQALYSVIFEDNEVFKGGSYSDTKWLDIPNKKIKRIFYSLPDGNYLLLKNYDKYYHMIEAIIDINGKEKGKTKLQYAYIMGKRKGLVTSYRITLFENQNSKYKIGDIVRRTFKETDDKIQKLNCQGWK